MLEITKNRCYNSLIRWQRTLLIGYIQNKNLLICSYYSEIGLYEAGVMIILHRGTDYDGNIHYGYAIKQESSYYIINNKGEKNKVRENTITPVFDNDWLNKHKSVLKNLPDKIEPKNLHRVEDYLSEISPAAAVRFKYQGADYLEDLSTWTDEEILKVRAIGICRLKKIKEIMLRNGIEPFE